MTEKYNEVYNRIVSPYFDLNDFKRREEKATEYFKNLDNEKYFSKFIYSNKTKLQSFSFKIIFKEILFNFMEIFYDEELFPIIKDFRNTLENYDFNLNYYNDEKEYYSIFEYEKEEEKKDIIDISKNPFAKIYIENINKITDESVNFFNLTKMYCNKDKLLFDNEEFIDIIGCFIKYAFIKNNRVSAEEVEEVRKELFNMSTKLFNFLCDSIKIIYFNNLFNENSKQISTNFFADDIYINEKEAKEINKLNDYVYYTVYDEDYSKNYEQKGDKVKIGNNLGSSIEVMKEIEEKTRNLNNKINKYKKFLKINHFIDYYHDIHIENIKKNYKNFLEKILEKFDNIIKLLNKTKENKGNYYDLIEKKFIYDELEEISNAKYKLLKVKNNGYFNKENYTIEKINDTDFKFYVMDVYLSDFDYDEEEYEKWLDERRKEYENDSYEAYIWNKNNRYSTPKKELDEKIDAVATEELNLLNELENKLKDIINTEKSSIRLEKMREYYNSKYELHVKSYNKLDDEINFNYKNIIAEEIPYNFITLEYPEEIKSFLYLQENLFEAN